MQQVKFFKTTELDIEDTERTINTWISKENVSVVNIFGNLAPQGAVQSGGSMLSKSATVPSDIFIVVVYEKD